MKLLQTSRDIFPGWEAVRFEAGMRFEIFFNQVILSDGSLLNQAWRFEVNP